MRRKKTVAREAVVLEYDPNHGVPQVVAQGSGFVAERIISSAIEHNIPIHEDPELAHTLNALRIGDDIPPELYRVVAQILLYVAKIDQKNLA